MFCYIPAIPGLGVTGVRRESRAIPRRDDRARNARTCLALLAIAFLPCAPTTVGAAPPGEPENGETLEYLDLVVDEALFKEIAERFLDAADAGADEAGLIGSWPPLMRIATMQESHVRQLFIAYRQAIEDIDRQVRENVQRAGIEEARALIHELDPATDAQRTRNASGEEIRRLQAEGIEKRHDPRWDDVRAIVRRMEAHIDRGCKQADTLLDQFIYQMAQGSRDPAQTQRAILRFIRRSRLDTKPRYRSDDFISPVDILRLVGAELAPDGELHPIGEAPEDTPDAAAEDETEPPPPGILLRRIVEAYEIELDQLLLERLNARRRAEVTRSTQFVLTPGDPEYDRHEEREGRKWKARFDVSQRARDAIAALLEERVGPDAAARWRLRFLQALCPELMKPRWPHRMVQWLEARGDHTPEQLEAAAALQESYRLRWDDLRQRAIASGIRVMERRGFPLGPAAEHEAYWESIAALHALGRDTLAQFMRLLNDPQRSDLKGQLLNTRGAARMIEQFGPAVDSSYVPGLKTKLAETLDQIACRSSPRHSPVASHTDQSGM